MGIPYQNTCMTELHPICACDQCVWSSSTIYYTELMWLFFCPDCWISYWNRNTNWNWYWNAADVSNSSDRL